MEKTKAEESKEMEDQVAEFLKKGGEIEQLDIREAKLKDLELSKRFFAKTHYLLFNPEKKKGPSG